MQITFLCHDEGRVQTNPRHAAIRITWTLPLLN